MLFIYGVDKKGERYGRKQRRRNGILGSSRSYYCSSDYFMHSLNCKIDLFLWLCTLIAYGYNISFLKWQTTGLLKIICISYFNDFFASIFILSLANMLLNIYDIQLEKLISIIVFIFSCSLIWELSATLIKPTAIFDSVDMVVYLLGGVMYLYFKKCLLRGERK